MKKSEISPKEELWDNAKIKNSFNVGNKIKSIAQNYLILQI